MALLDTQKELCLEQAVRAAMTGVDDFSVALPHVLNRFSPLPGINEQLIIKVDH